jgi:prepilin-type N-terminal cleavage/methylation domain-containing protein
MKINISKSNGGFTLVELMITVLVSAILFGAVTSTFMFFNRTFVAVGNYVEMNQVNRMAIDTMSQRIRQAQGLVSFNTNSIVFRDLGSNTLSYNYSPSMRTLTQVDTNGVKVLLRDCDSLTFNMAQRNPSNSFGFYPATSTNTAKIISMTWATSKTILGHKANTESVQTARVVMRN